MITKDNVEKAIKEIEKEIDNFPISSKNLVKFKNSEEDQRFKSYIYGVGGQCLRFMPALINKLNIKKILELGNREGVSTLCIYDHLKDDSEFISVDIVKDQRYCPDHMFNDKRMKFIYGDVSDLSIYKGNYPDGSEFLYLDTIHYDFQVTDEFEIYQHFLADRALVAIDDIHVNDKGKFFNRVKYHKWDLTKLCHVSGWGLFLFERHKPENFETRLFKAYQVSAKIWKRKFDELQVIVNGVERRKPLVILKKIVKKVPILHKTLIKVNNATLKIGNNVHHS